MSSVRQVRTVRPAYVHPSAIVETDEVGEGTRVWAFSHIMQGASIGSDCNVGDHCFIEGGAVIGDNVTIKNGNMVWEGVTLESGVFVGPAVVFTNDRYPRSPRLPQVEERYRDRGWLVPTVVKQGATLGAGAILVAGITIGEFSMVAAGAVVTKDVPPHALVVGNPARPRGWVCRCGQPLIFENENASASCRHCGSRFTTDGTSIKLGQ